MTASITTHVTFKLFSDVHLRGYVMLRMYHWRRCGVSYEIGVRCGCSSLSPSHWEPWYSTLSMETKQVEVADNIKTFGKLAARFILRLTSRRSRETSSRLPTSQFSIHNPWRGLTHRVGSSVFRVFFIGW
jgi:hypothetical protein